jgi:hypothetical protein
MALYVYLHEFDDRGRLIANMPIGRQMPDLKACLALIASRDELMVEPGLNHQYMILEIEPGRARYCLFKEKVQ